ARLWLPVGRACSERLLGALREVLKRGAIADGEIGEHLAVDLDAGPAEPVHEAAVGQLVQPRGRVDARDPEPAEVGLLAAAVPVCVLLGPLDGFLGRLPQLGPPAEVALGELHDLVLALQTRDVALDAGHGSLLTPSTDA